MRQPENTRIDVGFLEAMRRRMRQSEKTIKCISKVTETFITAAGVAIGIGLALAPKRLRDIVLNEVDPAAELYEARRRFVIKEAMRWPMTTMEVEHFMIRHGWDIEAARVAMAQSSRFGRNGLAS